MDLIVKSIAVSPPNPTAGEPLDFSVVVSNLGSTDAGPFSIDYYAHRPLAPGEGEIGEFTCGAGALAAGESRKCEFIGAIFLPGSYNMWAQVDTNDEVEETNEANNIFGPQKLEVNGAAILLGDTSCNGVVNSVDALLLLQFVAGHLNSLPCPANSDTNQDGTIDPVDAALILQFVAGLINSLPPPAASSP